MNDCGLKPGQAQFKDPWAYTMTRTEKKSV